MLAMTFVRSSLVKSVAVYRFMSSCGNKSEDKLANYNYEDVIMMRSARNRAWYATIDVCRRQFASNSIDCRQLCWKQERANPPGSPTCEQMELRSTRTGFCYIAICRIPYPFIAVQLLESRRLRRHPTVPSVLYPVIWVVAAYNGIISSRSLQRLSVINRTLLSDE
ncbi:unnamed protein product [Clavelina lepadiformis]|uniref:Uncharacterized protein n=1 Tax=Clavelina lepadiformis TaxID=159417 RepID=A0ABP0G7L0_CLALP